jgi:hypothetical protein
MRIVGLSILLACSFASLSLAAEGESRRWEGLPKPKLPWLNRLVKDFSILQNYQAYADLAPQIAAQSSRIQQLLPSTVLDAIRTNTTSNTRAALLSAEPYYFEAEGRRRLALSGQTVSPAIFELLVESAAAVEDDIREAQEDQTRMGAQVKRVREYASFMRGLANSPSNSLSVQLFNQDCGAPTNFFTTKLAFEFDSLPDCQFVTSQVIEKSQIVLLADDLSERLVVMEETLQKAQETLNLILERRNAFVAQVRSLLPIIKNLSATDIQQVK